MSVIWEFFVKKLKFFLDVRFFKLKMTINLLSNIKFFF